jgi:hypothetical protein
MPEDSEKEVRPPAPPPETVRETPVFAGGGKGKMLRPPQKATCLMLVFAFLIVAMSAIGAAVWLYEPASVKYQPVIAAKERLTYLGEKQGAALPAGWDKMEGRQAWKSAQGEILMVQHGTVASLNLAPKTFSGKPVKGSYTSAAYANSLSKRIGENTEIVRSNYVTLGARKGVEAILRQEDRMFRGFALVNDRLQALELLFVVPGNEQSPGWKQAEGVFTSLTTMPPPPKATKDDGEKPEPAH